MVTVATLMLMLMLCPSLFCIVVAACAVILDVCLVHTTDCLVLSTELLTEVTLFNFLRITRNFAVFAIVFIHKSFKLHSF